jgi:hypothetical protein
MLNASQVVDQAAHDMLAAYNAGNAKETRRQAEAIYNVIVGNQDPTYGDLNGDGKVTDPGDGYGLLLNGDHIGYIQGVFAHAGYAASTNDTDANIQLHATHVEICMANLTEWTPILRELVHTILTGDFSSKLHDPIYAAVSQADKILNGIDLNGDEQIRPVPGEGGAKTGYQHAYYMANMSVYPGPHVQPPVAPPLQTTKPTPLNYGP